MQAIMVSDARLSFPTLMEATAYQSNPQKYFSADLLMDETNPAWAQFHQIVQQIAVDSWGQQAERAMQFIHNDRKKRCYGWGQERVDQKTGEIYQGYEGKVYIIAKRREQDGQPQFIDHLGNAIPVDNTMATMAAARALYGGCRVNALIKPFKWDNDNGRGISCELVAIQFAKDDTPFGEGVGAPIDTTGMFGQVQQPAHPQAAPGAQPPATPPGMPGQMPQGMPGQMPQGQPQAAPNAGPVAPAGGVAPQMPPFTGFGGQQ